MKKSVITGIFFLLIINIFINPILAKYILEERIEVATIQIDRTAPQLEVGYSTKELTLGNVEVTIKANEQIQEIEGWFLQEDKKTLKKEYSKDSKEEITVKDLSGNTEKTVVEINNIDKEKPIIKIQEILNSNTSYPNYANKNDEIMITISIRDNKKILKSLENDDIKILVDNKEIIPESKTITIQKDTEQEKIVLFKILGIIEEGNLSLKIPKDIIKDEIGNSNIEVEKDLQIKIDNTSPQATYSQEKMEDGKIKAQITANEKIRNLEGWTNKNDTTIEKVFSSNVSYITEIEDLAGNKAELEINVTQATNIILSYASHNSEVSWTYGYGNYDIAGLEAIKKNAKYKTESLAFSILGNVEKDFLQARVYVHTYWGDGAASICHQSGQIYYHGWNPPESEWSTLLNKENIILEGRNYIQFGGVGINRDKNTDTNGNNPIPESVSTKYKYGISGMQLKLKDDSEYSIVYQIYVDQVGWVKPAKNGEVTCYKENKPISALRIALIPNSELNALLDTWNKDTRKIF